MNIYTLFLIFGDDPFFFPDSFHGSATSILSERIWNLKIAMTI